MMVDMAKYNENQKQMHGMIQNLRGSMRVYCRVKPLHSFYEDELNESVQSIMRKSAPEDITDCIKFHEPIIQTGGAPSKLTSLDIQFSSGEPTTFHLDGIFKQTSTQKAVFNEVQPFITSAINGENVCIFAYGQTGSGKTHTMEGPNADMLFDETTFNVHELSGILPRTGIFLFDTMRRMEKDLKRTFRLEISAIEVYCDTVRDLFSSELGIVDLLTDPQTRQVVIKD